MESWFPSPGMSFGNSALVHQTSPSPRVSPIFKVVELGQKGLILIFFSQIWEGLHALQA